MPEWIKMVTMLNVALWIWNQLAHHIKVNDELSDIVADQSKRIEALERRVGMLMQREAERENEGIEYVADQRPPHW